MNSGLSRRSITKVGKIAGISPYDGKLVHYSFSTYQQQIMDMWKTKRLHYFPRINKIYLD